MTTSLESRIHAELAWTWRDQIGAAPIVFSNRLRSVENLADGSGDEQADAVWFAQDQILPAGQSTTFDLDMLDQSMFGDTITIAMERVKGLLIVNKNTTTTAYLLAGGAAVDPWVGPFGSAGDTVKVMPESPLLLANVHQGWDVGVGNSGLKIAAVGGVVTFDIAVLGTLADEFSTSSSSSGS
jgi:hypothetical protein